MAAMMSQFLHTGLRCEQGIDFYDIHSNFLDWSTLGETKAAISTIKKLGLPQKVLAFSSFPHLRRIKFYWKRLEPEFEIECIGLEKSIFPMNLFDMAYEKLAMVKAKRNLANYKPKSSIV